MESEILIITHSKDINSLFKSNVKLVEKENLEYSLFTYTEHHSSEIKRVVGDIINLHNSGGNIILYTSVDDLIREISIEITKKTIDYKVVRAYQFNDCDNYIECKVSKIGVNIPYMGEFIESQNSECGKWVEELFKRG